MPDPALTALSTVDNPAHDTLLSALDAAVPLWMLELDRMTPEIRELDRQVWARRSADAIAAHGDVLQYGSRRKGETAKVFNALAQGLAAAAYQPGGVTFAGRHWCTDHAECQAAATTAAAEVV